LVDPTVLLIEADVSVAHACSHSLEQVAMQVAWARDGATGVMLKACLLPDIVLVGLRLPDVNSVALVGQLVRLRDCGVIVLAGAQDEQARIISLEAGADDYLAKSALALDVTARVRAVHRRVNVRERRSPTESIEPVLVVGPIRINQRHRSVHTLDGRRVGLTSTEYTTLELLARANGAAIPRERISEVAFSRPWRTADRSVDQLVLNLRHKLPVNEDGSLLIQSVRGAGYWMRAPDQPTRPCPDLARLAGGQSIQAAWDHYVQVR